MHLSWLYVYLFLNGIFNGNAIYPGEEAEDGQFPYLALILINEELQSSLCGGAILDDTHILTAAHCVTNGATPINHRLVKVTVGRARIFRMITPELSVAKITVHPEYRLPKCPTTVDRLLAQLHFTPAVTEFYKAQNDIAVLTMEEPLRMDRYVKKIDYLPYDILPYGDMCEFAGWGVNNQPNDIILAFNLRWTRLKVFKESECSTLLLPSSPGDFCAGDEDNAVKTLLGDSGSPLVCHGFLVGLLSAGMDEFGVPDIFVRVSHYKSFIESVTNKQQASSAKCICY